MKTERRPRQNPSIRDFLHTVMTELPEVDVNVKMLHSVGLQKWRAGSQRRRNWGQKAND